MSDAVDNVARLRQVAEQLPAVGEDGHWLAGRLRDWLDGGAAAGETLEQALGIATPRGGRPWWAVEALKRKADAIARLRNLLPAGEYRSEAAAIRAAAARYRAGRWRHDQQVAADQLEPSRAALRDLLAATSGAVPSRRSIERALEVCGTSSPISCR